MTFRPYLLDSRPVTKLVKIKLHNIECDENGTFFHNIHEQYVVSWDVKNIRALKIAT